MGSLAIPYLQVVKGSRDLLFEIGTPPYLGNRCS